ncbi:MAG: polymer-forming cytoskeletal protein [Planctomycetota bacterium]|nr:polymer-forming cytoskeletal protein [Planctomycetota bacterium]
MNESETMTVIGKDTSIKGEMSFERSARILGGFEGKISSAGEVHVGETARCRASIEAASVTVDGRVEGDIVASECIKLNESAQVVGNLRGASLVVAGGASFVGQCRVGPSAVVDELTPAANRLIEAKPTLNGLGMNGSRMSAYDTRESAVDALSA